MTSKQNGIGARIKQLRDERKISQEALAAEMNIRRTAISSIENGERRVSIEEAIRFSKFFGLSVEQLSDESKEIKVVLEEASKEQPRETLRISVPQKNVKKFKEVLLYILSKVGAKPNVGQTVLYKLLYFVDFDFYERYEEQIIGATYIKNDFGPTPVEFIKIVKAMIKGNELEEVQSTYFERQQTKYLPHREPDLKCFSADEIKHIDDVLARFSDKNATQLSEYSHKDVPWITATPGQPIDYESVFYRTDATSVRTYD